MAFKFWHNITIWQQRLVIIVSIIISISFLYPEYKSIKREIDVIIEFQKHATQIELDIKNLNSYIKVLSGILKASLHKVNDKSYVVSMPTGHMPIMVNVKIRKTLSGNIYVFVPDDKVGVYFLSYNNDESKYSYTDFDGERHLLHEIPNLKELDK